MAKHSRRLALGRQVLTLKALLLLASLPATAEAPAAPSSERLEALAQSLVTVLRQEQRALALRAAELDALEHASPADMDEPAADDAQLQRLAELRAELDGATAYAVAADRITLLASNFAELQAPAIDGATLQVMLVAAELVAPTDLRTAPNDTASVLSTVEAGTVLVVIGVPPDPRWRLVATPQQYGFILTDALAEL